MGASLPFAILVNAPQRKYPEAISPPGAGVRDGGDEMTAV